MTLLLEVTINIIDINEGHVCLKPHQDWDLKHGPVLNRTNHVSKRGAEATLFGAQKQPHIMIHSKSTSPVEDDGGQGTEVCEFLPEKDDEQVP